MLHLTEVSEKLFNGSKALVNKGFSRGGVRVETNYTDGITARFNVKNSSCFGEHGAGIGVHSTDLFRWEIVSFSDRCDYAMMRSRSILMSEFRNISYTSSGSPMRTASA